MGFPLGKKTSLWMAVSVHVQRLREAGEGLAGLGRALQAGSSLV